MKKLSKLEETLALQMRALKLSEPEREYRFDSRRRYRFDFAWPTLSLAVEVEGGTHIRGRHTRPTGFRNDCRKYNLATLQGWRVFRFDSFMVNSGEAINFLEEWFSVNQNQGEDYVISHNDVGDNS